LLLNGLPNCPFCKQKNKISVEEEDRGQLQIKKGNEIDFTCQSCHKKEKVHINNIYAEPSKIIYIASIIVSILVTVLFWNLGFIITLSFGIPMLIFLYQQSLARNFNNYKIRR